MEQRHVVQNYGHQEVEVAESSLLSFGDGNFDDGSPSMCVLIHIPGTDKWLMHQMAVDAAGAFLELAVKHVETLRRRVAESGG